MELQGHQVHGTGVQAFAAADAVGVIDLVVILPAVAGNGVVTLDGAAVQSVLGNAHHGAAAEDLIRLAGEAARRLDEVGIEGADGGAEIGGPGYGTAGDGENTLDQGHTAVDRVIDGGAGGHIEHGAAYGSGKPAGRDAPARDRLDKLLFRALGVTDPQSQHLHVPVGGGTDSFNGLGLILFDADGNALRLQDLPDDPQASQDTLRALPHQTIVGGDIRLALGAVDDDRIHLAQAGGELHIRREARAAHAGDPRLMDDGDQLLGSKLVDAFVLFQVGTQDVPEIVLDDHAHTVGAGGRGPHLHGDDRAGNGGVDRYAQSLAVTDLLTDGHAVAHLDQGRAGSADMLRHGNADGFRMQGIDGSLAGQLLVALGMYAAKKRTGHKVHHLNSFLYVFTIPYTC